MWVSVHTGQAEVIVPGSTRKLLFACEVNWKEGSKKFPALAQTANAS